MDISDTSAVIAALNHSARASETWRVETFDMHRESNTYGSQDVKVTILDRGAGSDVRYMVFAEASTGQRCASNSERDLDVAIATTHWQELDH